MSGSLSRLSATAQTAEAQRLRLHCLCGDELAVAGEPQWFEPLGSVTEDAGDGCRDLLFLYRGPNDLAISFGRRPADVVGEILDLARDLSLTAADRRWRALAARLGPVPLLTNDPQRATIPLDGRVIVAARRAVHPSHVIDRLMLRDRERLMGEVERLLVVSAFGEPALRYA